MFPFFSSIVTNVFKVINNSLSFYHHQDTPRLWSPLLASFSFLYALGVRGRLSGYKRGFLKMNTLPGFVVSIGNLTAGGTGKTPAVIMLAKWAREEGYRVAVLSRGYGGGYRSKILEISDGSNIKVHPRESGDEAYLLAKHLGGVPVVLSRERFLAGKFAYQKYGTDFFILDDGFQHLSLRRDLDIVLIDAVSPLGNGHLLPWGPLREPMGELERADVFIITRTQGGKRGGRATVLLKERFPATPIYYSDHVPERVVFPCMRSSHDHSFLRGKRVIGFAGIAKPEEFKETLLSLGAEVVRFQSFPDHHPFSTRQMQALMNLRKELGAEILITTAKDWVRISSFAPYCLELAYLDIEFVFSGSHDDEEEFYKRIRRTARERGPSL